ncbi:MAG TPA: SagB/ThcOx family dehydrogenase [Terriglobales bacterium]|nr:SagB/ThcOx family dehydrogenase [Terriglobales bacterium]
MRRRLFLSVLLFSSFAFAQTTASLPAPQLKGGMSLTEALATRRSIRSLTPTPLTQQELSQLLWSAQGITDSKGHRTAPSARARYFVQIYVATHDGVSQYVPEGHKLRKLTADDVRSRLSQQPTTAAAAAVFIITGDYDRAAQGSSREIASRWVDLEAGHAAQNLLLQATALSLGAVPMGGFDPDAVWKLLSLPTSSRPIYLIPVGHPK